jgi:hypothetical protein
MSVERLKTIIHHRAALEDARAIHRGLVRIWCKECAEQTVDACKHNPLAYNFSNRLPLSR